MTVTIQLSEEEAAVLEAQAAQEGLTVDAWLQRIAEQYAQVLPSSPKGSPGQRPIWDLIAERMRTVPAEVFERLPQDGASEHDHYLYGSTKRNG